MMFYLVKNRNIFLVRNAQNFIVFLSKMYSSQSYFIEYRI